MRTLPCPSRDRVRDHLITALEVYESNGVRRGYEVTPAELDSIVTLYDAYDCLYGAPDVRLRGPGLDEALRTAVHDGYEFTQLGRKLAAIRAELMRGVELCPICGISAPRELDHHLPRSAFHPLAIYVRNLVPLCHDCNHSKGPGEAAEPEMRFIHPYFDDLPDVLFLRAAVSIDNGGLLVEYDIDPAAALPELTRSRLSYQLRRLKLNERYAREINAYLTSHTIAIRCSYDSGGADTVRSFLNMQAAVEEIVFHRNHWRPVLLRALASHQAFCDGGFTVVLPLAA
ncbi:MAG: HNH endonuclease [Alphaproteobacteria bacterium]